MQIGIIGLGLIGGSIAKELNQQMNIVVVGCDINKSHEQEALKLALVEELQQEDELIKSSDIILCCIPVNHLENKIGQILDLLNEKQVLIDTGSTKALICKSVEDHPARSRYVASHPLAGTENSGPKAAIHGLFRNKKNIICEPKLSANDALDSAIQLFKSLGMDSYFLEPEDHDKHMAYVSHLSHVSSFMLGLTVLEIEKDEKQIANLASTGFESTVRLAKSSPETWGAIFNKNKLHLIQALEAYIAHLNDFLSVLKNNDTNRSMKLMKEANEVKRILDGIKK